MYTCPVCANMLPDGAVYCARCNWLAGAPGPAGYGPAPGPPGSGAPGAGGYGPPPYLYADPPTVVGPPPFDAGGWSPYPMPPARKVNGLAIGAMCTSIGAIVLTLACGIGVLAAPVGAVLGHVSLSQIKQTGEDGRGMALAGIIIGWALTALLAVGIVLIVVLAASS